MALGFRVGEGPLSGVWIGMMVKNEAVELPVTLLSINASLWGGLFLYDTGSSDSTIEIARKWSVEAGLPFRFTSGVFSDFSTSRNEMLNNAALLGIEWLLVLDAADEVHVKNFHPGRTKLSGDVYNCKKVWLLPTGENHEIPFRCLLRPSSGLRYRGVVHEVLLRKVGTFRPDDFRNIDIALHQDRTKFGGSSSDRLQRDAVLLKAELLRNPDDLHANFISGQTKLAMGETDLAISSWEQFLDKFEFKCGRGGPKECIDFKDYVPAAHLRIGILLTQKGLMSAARDHLTSTWKVTGCPEPLIIIGYGLKQSGEATLAKKYLHKAHSSFCKPGHTSSGMVDTSRMQKIIES